MGWRELSPWHLRQRLSEKNVTLAEQRRHLVDVQLDNRQLIGERDEYADALEQTTTKARDLERLADRFEMELNGAKRELTAAQQKTDYALAEMRHRELEVAKLQARLEVSEERAAYWHGEAQSKGSDGDVAKENLGRLAAQLNADDGEDAHPSEVTIGFMERFNEVLLDGWRPPASEKEPLSGE
jgi:regulator of replication initiation timing